MTLYAPLPRHSPPRPRLSGTGRRGWGAGGPGRGGGRSPESQWQASPRPPSGSGDAGAASSALRHRPGERFFRRGRAQVCRGGDPDDDPPPLSAPRPRLSGTGGVTSGASGRVWPWRGTIAGVPSPGGVETNPAPQPPGRPVPPLVVAVSPGGVIFRRGRAGWEVVAVAGADRRSAPRASPSPPPALGLLGPAQDAVERDGGLDQPREPHAAGAVRGRKVPGRREARISRGCEVIWSKPPPRWNQGIHSHRFSSD